MAVVDLLRFSLEAKQPESRGKERRRKALPDTERADCLVFCIYSSFAETKYCAMEKNQHFLVIIIAILLSCCRLSSNPHLNMTTLRRFPWGRRRWCRSRCPRASRARRRRRRTRRPSTSRRPHHLFPDRSPRPNKALKKIEVFKIA